MPVVKPIRLLDLGTIPAIETQAIYHALAESMTGEDQDTLILCRPGQPYLCLGFHQSFTGTFNPAACAERGLPVVRRQLGGGATYLDSDQIFYQCVFHHNHLPVVVKDIFASTLAAPVQVLRNAGLNAELCDTNEIEVSGRRIAGTGGGRIGEATVVVGNLLFDFDFAAMAAVWHVPSTAFRALAEKAMRASLVNLGDLPTSLSLVNAAERLRDEFARQLGRPLQPGSLTANEREAVRKKGLELTAPGYLALHGSVLPSKPIQSLKISARSSICYDEIIIDGVQIRGNFWLIEGKIREAILESVPTKQWHTTEQELHEIPFPDWKEHLPASFVNTPME